MTRSKKLEDTSLWQTYRKRISQENERIAWVEKIYESAVTYLDDVRQEFKNYTLHNGTHILNVLDAMGGLLGDCIEKLTDGEIELLILVASMHDLGMVYTKEEKELWFEKERAYKDFLRKYSPEWIGCKPKDWPEDIQQWYLRTLHPFRIVEIFQNEAWKELIEKRPKEIISMQCIEAVCQAHGEEPEELHNNSNLEYLAASDVDPLFCALLLRLADLLDFDDTRAPKVLYSYVADNKRSREEWKKHQSSAGFSYPAHPTTKELPYKARCKNPTIEHGVRKFLDWVDEELQNCAKLQMYCSAEWQREFPFPRAVLRSEIESDGYLSGNFCYTMDHEQILDLLMGKNLYDNRDVFVRELLQNAIDATLLRGEMDDNFIPEESRIDFWEWMDKEGNFWFRIDDQGTGMTLGMLQRYFLKVGNSYYASQELKKDLCEYGCSKDYQGISRFGIGFLSCFLCGDYVEVSTLYFNRQKNLSEEVGISRSQVTEYGLQLHVTGLTGDFVLKSQAEKHSASPLPMPELYKNMDNGRMERQGYRAKAGTSVVIRLNPGKIGTLNLCKTVEKYLCGAKVPVYYNNKRIGRTYKEAMEIVHEMAGKKVFELSERSKRKFDNFFPEVKGNYPKLTSLVIPLDADENGILQDLSGVSVRYDIYFEKAPQWNDKDQVYKVYYSVTCLSNIPEIYFSSENVKGKNYKRENKAMGFHSWGEWSELEREYGYAKTEALKEKFKMFSSCPQEESQLGETWLPFSDKLDLRTVWAEYLDDLNARKITFNINDFECQNIGFAFGNAYCSKVMCVYQGVLADGSLGENAGIYGCSALFWLGKKWRPVVDIARSKVVELPLSVLLAIWSIINRHGMVVAGLGHNIAALKEWEYVTLQEWREARNLLIDQLRTRKKADDKVEIHIFYEGVEDAEDIYKTLGSFSVSGMRQIMNGYIMAYLQDNYSMTINYENGQIISFYEEKENSGEGEYDNFPPMMFCMAASDQSRKYICHAYVSQRRGITVDHPFMAWLLENSVQLNQHFRQQFWRIVMCLYAHNAEDIINEFCIIREQLCTISAYYGLDVTRIPQLSRKDFWPPESDKKEEQKCPF